MLTSRFTARIAVLARPLWYDPPLALLCLIVLTLPLEFLRPWFPTGSLDVARLGMLLGIGWLAWRAAIDRGSFLRLPAALVIAPVAIIAVEAASFAMTRWPSAPKSLLAVVAYAAFAGFVATSVRNRNSLLILTAAFVLSGALEGLIAIVEQIVDVHLFADYPWFWLDRRSGTFWDPNIAARMLLVTLTAALGLDILGQVGSGRGRLLILVAIALMTFGILLTLSRTLWLLLVPVVMVSTLAALLRRTGRLAPLVVVGTFAIGLVVYPLALKRTGEVPPPDPASIVAPGPPTTDTTTFVDPILNALRIDGTRRYLARAGIAMFEDHLLVGVGLGGFQPMILGPYRPLVPAAPAVEIVSLVHTDLVRVAAEEGVLGLAAWLSLFVAIALVARRAIRAAGRAERAAVWIAISAIGLITLASQTEGRFYADPYLWLFIGLLAALATRSADWSRGGRVGLD